MRKDMLHKINKSIKIAIIKYLKIKYIGLAII